MDEELNGLLDAFYSARSAVRNAIEHRVNEAKMHKIEASKLYALAKLATDELNEESPEPLDQ